MSSRLRRPHLSGCVSHPAVAVVSARKKKTREEGGRRAQEQLKISSAAVDGLFLSALSPLSLSMPRRAVSSSFFALSLLYSRCIEGMCVDKSYIFNFSFSITFALDLLPLGLDYRQMHSLAQTVVLTSYIMNGRRMSTNARENNSAPPSRLSNRETLRTE